MREEYRLTRLMFLYLFFYLKEGYIYSFNQYPKNVFLKDPKNVFGI